VHLETLASLLSPRISPGQRAVCRLIEGRPPRDREQGALYAKLLGREWGPDLATRRSRIVLRAGRGATKTTIAGWYAIWRALDGPVEGLAAGEWAYVPIVAPRMDAARITLGLVWGTVATAQDGEGPAAARLSSHVWRPEHAGGDVVRFRRGVKIGAYAADRGGVNVRSRTVLSLVCDEANLFRAHGAAVVNDRDVVTAAEARMVPDAQTLMLSSPWVEEGLFYDIFEADFGRSRDALVLAVDHPLTLNPGWTPKRNIVEGTSEHAREIEGRWVADGTETIATREGVLAVMRGAPNGHPEAGDFAPMHGHAYCDALDMAGSGNDRTGYAIGHFDRAGILVVDAVRGWTAAVPEEDRFRAIAQLRRVYRIASPCAADAYAYDVCAALGRTFGVELTRDAGNRAAQAQHLGQLVRDRAASFPPSERLMFDLPMISVRLAPGGTLGLYVPRDRAGGHCDEAEAVIRLAATASASAVDQVRRPGQRLRLARPAPQDDAAAEPFALAGMTPRD